MNDGNLQHGKDSERVPSFLHLNMDRVRSISSRLDEGYVKEKIDEEQETTELTARLTASINALFGIGMGSLRGSTEGRTASSVLTEESRAIHHYSYVLLEEWLKEYESEWFHDLDTSLSEMEESHETNTALTLVQNEISEGDVIRVTGDMEVLDFNTSLSFIDGMITGIENFDEKMKNAADENIDMNVMRALLTGDSSNNEDAISARELFDISSEELLLINSIFSLFDDVMPDQYREMVAANIYPMGSDEKLNFWALIRSSDLENDPVEILSKYQASKIPNCTVLARVETICEADAADDVPEGTQGDIEFGMIHHFSDEIAAEFGLKVKYPSIAISPIAIYR